MTGTNDAVTALTQLFREQMQEAKAREERLMQTFTAMLTSVQQPRDQPSSSTNSGQSSSPAPKPISVDRPCLSSSSTLSDFTAWEEAWHDYALCQQLASQSRETRVSALRQAFDEDLKRFIREGVILTHRRRRCHNRCGQEVHSPTTKSLVGSARILRPSPATQRVLWLLLHEPEGVVPRLWFCTNHTVHSMYWEFMRHVPCCTGIQQPTYPTGQDCCRPCWWRDTPQAVSRIWPDPGDHHQDVPCWGSCSYDWGWHDPVLYQCCEVSIPATETL